MIKNIYNIETTSKNYIANGFVVHNCYMKRWGEQKPLRLDKKEFKTDLGEGNFIFIGSSCDLFAADIPEKWIQDTFDHCKKFKNKYLFQSKNPERIFWLRSYLPPDVIIGTTIETNRRYPQMGNAPEPGRRAQALRDLAECGFKTMVTVEPIMKFWGIELWNLICICQPEWVNIGADSQNSGLPEPDIDEIKELIGSLVHEGINVKIKDNLKRLLKNGGL